MNGHPPEQEIFSHIASIVVEALRVSPAKVTREARIFNDLDAESLDIIDIRFRMEKAFSFKIDNDELLRYLGTGLSAQELKERFTVGSLVKYVQQRLEQSAPMS